MKFFAKTPALLEHKELSVPLGTPLERARERNAKLVQRTGDEIVRLEAEIEALSATLKDYRKIYNAYELAQKHMEG